MPIAPGFDAKVVETRQLVFERPAPSRFDGLYLVFANIPLSSSKGRPGLRRRLQ